MRLVSPTLAILSVGRLLRAAKERHRDRTANRRKEKILYSRGPAGLLLEPL